MLFRRDGSLRCALLAAKNIPTAVDTATPLTCRQSTAGRPARTAANND
jgi:hypothetical protein